LVPTVWAIWPKKSRLPRAIMSKSGRARRAGRKSRPIAPAVRGNLVALETEASPLVERRAQFGSRTFGQPSSVAL
jgi:hypothetical protein